MNTMKLLSIAVLMIICGYTSAQTTILNSSKVNIGDQEPNIQFTSLINYPSDHLKLTDFNGKILILDFWTFGCTACVASWPKLMELQREFKNNIQIITVNPYSEKKEVEAFIKRQEKISGKVLTLPVACGDKKLFALFPHKTVPHVVFIDEKGFVKYITASEYLNRETISNMISQKQMQIPEKTDMYTKITLSKPLFINGNVPNRETGTNLLWSSVINPYSSEISIAYQFGRYNDRTFGWISNYCIKAIFQTLYGREINSVHHVAKVPNGRIEFRNIDSASLVGRIDDINKPKNGYCVQVTSKRDISIELLKRKMIANVEQCFGLKTFWEEQNRKCLIISKNKFPLTIYKEGEKKAYVGENELVFNNTTVQEIIDNMLMSRGSYLCTYPIIDETGYTGNLGYINFVKSGKAIDYRDLALELQKHGLSFSIQDRVVPILVITQ